MKLETRNYKSGQAALIAVIFMMTIMLSAIFGVIGLSLKEARVAGKNYKSRNSFFAAEAGIDDAVYRIKRGKNLSSSYSVSLNGATADIDVTNISSNERRIVSSGDASGANRSLSAGLVTGTTDVSFFYGVQVGDGGLDMGENTKIAGNVYSNGNIIGENGSAITGSATVAGGINSAPSIEAAVTDSNFAFATASGNRDIAQSFIANATDKLNKVSVFLGKSGAPGSNITLRITNDDGGEPDKNDIASTVIPASMVGSTVSWIGASFASPPNLTNGNKYWIVLDYGSNSASNYWLWGKDSADSYADNTGKYTSDWDSQNANWSNAGGDLAFQAWIGGVSTKIDGLTIGTSTAGTGHANVFVDTSVHGSACPNQYCFVENPPREEMPISEGVIQDWRNGGSAGGTCVPPTCDSDGNYSLTVNGGSASLGPIKITGDLTVSNNSTLTVNGLIYVAGNINLSNGCVVKLSSGYGSLSGVIVTDGTVNVSNNCTFSGSGTQGSYIMIMSAKNAPAGDVINVNNNAVSVIFYASNGRINFSNNAAAKEATAYGIDLENNATITYESGLSNVNFSSGPAGGWDIIEWKEIIP
ncbi:MAG: choice-of-anchor R domain-containing protein [bacterium]|nr:choice-of-anchor R domain-containing protein [bacterium]